jgi:hypothetical protein
MPYPTRPLKSYHHNRPASPIAAERKCSQKAVDRNEEPYTSITLTKWLITMLKTTTPFFAYQYPVSTSDLPQEYYDTIDILD